MPEKFKDIAELTADELRNKLDESKKELFQLRFKLATRQLQNTSKLGEVRHRIAQIHTVLRKKAAVKEGANA